MKWTVLSDNRTNDSRLETEHGLSILLDTGHYHILLDTGASDMFIRNAEHLGIDLSTVDYVFISHGHSDHAGGLKHLMKINDKAQVIVSPDAVSGKFYSKRQYLHSITTKWPEIMQERMVFVDDSCKMADDLHIIAHIPQTYSMPKGNQHLFVQNANGNYINDDFRHELALYTDGLLFTGCAHSGLENILAACPYPVHTVVGGFHLLDGMESEEELTELAKRQGEAYPNTQFYTSHCTGDKVFATLKAVMGDQLHAFSCGMSFPIEIQYDALIEPVPEKGGAYVRFPYDIKQMFGKGRLKVHATFDGISYDGSIVNMGVKNEDGSVCYILGLLKEIRRQLNKQPGNVVHVTISIL